MTALAGFEIRPQFPTLRQLLSRNSFIVDLFGLATNWAIL